MRFSLRKAAGITLAYLSAVGPPAIAFVVMHAESGLAIALCYPALTTTLALVRKQVGGRAGKLLLGLIVLLLLLGAMTITVNLNLIPASAYLAWFQLAQANGASGVLSLMFTLKVSFFSALLAGCASGKGAVASVAALGAALLVVLLAVFQQDALAAAAIGCMAVATVALAVRRVDKPGRLRAAATAIQLFGVCALLAWPLSRTRPTAYNPLVDTFSEDRLAPVVTAIYPDYPFLYGSPGYGYQLGEGRIGGRPTLTNRPVFRVDAGAGRTIYLRTLVYDHFTGDGWTQTSDLIAAQKQPDITITSATDGRVGVASSEQTSASSGGPAYVQPPPAGRLEGATAAPAVRPDTGVPATAAQLHTPSVAGTPQPPNGTAGTLPLTMGRSSYEIEVTLLADFFSSIPNTIHTGAVEIVGDDHPELRFGSMASGFVLDVPVVKGTRFLLAEGSGGTAETQPGEHRNTPADIKLFLQLPKNVPPEAVSIAASLNRGNPVATADAIRSYLSNGFRYTLNPPSPPSRLGSAWGFLLDTREGYCVQFATAFALLARLDGIPARYVTGFLVNMPEDADSAVVTGLSAHSWCEIWVPSVGWVTEEATPPMVAAFARMPDYLQLFNPTGNRYTRQQLEAIMGDRISVERKPAPPRRPVNPLPFLLVFGVLLASVGAALFLLRSIHAPGSVERRARITARRIIARSLRMGLPDPATVGWLGWGKAGAARFPEHQAVIERTARLLLKVFFSSEKAGRRDSRFLIRSCSRIFR